MNAAILPMKEFLTNIDYDKPLPLEMLYTLQIKMEHFFIVLDLTKP
ncbi:MAG: hypothetical protein ACFFBC_05725 [Promethearchaeota archaeon]